MSDPRTRSLLADAGRAAGRITVEYRRSEHASLLDLEDPSNPVIILHPDEDDDVLMAEIVDHCRKILEVATALQQHWRADGPDPELVADVRGATVLDQAVNDDVTLPATDVTARARRRTFEVMPGGAG